jgi:hypothetical protein
MRTGDMPSVKLEPDGHVISGEKTVLIKVKRKADWYILDTDADGNPIEKIGRPEIGYVIKVIPKKGAIPSIRPPIFQTSPIIEIKETGIDFGGAYIKFKTAGKSGKVYTWRP